MTCECRELAGKTKALRETYTSATFFPPKVPRELVWDRNRASALKDGGT